MPNGQDRRLAGIAHTGPGGVAVSAFGYGYDVGGSITRWTQSQPFHTVEPMSAWRIEQDAADQLTGVSVEGRAAGRQVFSYDLAGNRLTAQSGNATTPSSKPFTYTFLTQENQKNSLSPPSCENSLSSPTAS